MSSFENVYFECLRKKKKLEEKYVFENNHYSRLSTLPALIFKKTGENIDESTILNQF